MTDFQNILASLNKEQKNAVETIYGPVLIIAGPSPDQSSYIGVKQNGPYKPEHYRY